MDLIVLPRRRLRGAGLAASGAAESPQDRLRKYIPLEIAAAYPLLENGLETYVSAPVTGLAPRAVQMLAVAALLLYYALRLHAAFNRSEFRGGVRVRLQTQQTLISVIAFLIWIYDLRSVVWGDWYNAGLALILSALFVLFATLYVPSVDIAHPGPLPQPKAG